MAKIERVQVPYRFVATIPDGTGLRFRLGSWIISMVAEYVLRTVVEIEITEDMHGK